MKEDRDLIFFVGLAHWQALTKDLSELDWQEQVSKNGRQIVDEMNASVEIPFKAMTDAVVGFIFS